METDAQGKIDEAKFFLSKFIESYNNKEFKYYLSAFISAARSISMIMEQNAHYKEWFTKRKATEEESFIVKRAKKLRNINTHEKPIETHRVISGIFTVPEGFNAAEYLGKENMLNISQPDKNGNVFISVPTEAGEALRGEMDEYKIVNNLTDDEDLYDLCEKYLTILENIYCEWLTFRNAK